ncbi:hypothetical protein mRhiFer1_008207 [Rhinolophus ferrumequinum]|uniref:Uncharacterized protein n=1 Tax=Rhinolophus ferrumequinum TaxID=59479 RepID=A0A7J7W8B7_RHIFE|nr:hypothetical protein mRhiFer1_008207 [Rhinolophus ferrumequinum]
MSNCPAPLNLFLLQEVPRSIPTLQPLSCPPGCRPRAKGEAEVRTRPRAPAPCTAASPAAGGSWRPVGRRSRDAPAPGALPPSSPLLLSASTQSPICVPGCPRAPLLCTRRSWGGGEAVPEMC